MNTVDIELAEGRVEGVCDPAFESIADAFVENFRERGEEGASVCVHVDGERKVDLWGGMRDRTVGAEWAEDTISIVFSCTKAATAICAHILIDRGELDLHAKVTDYWPEFGQNGKQDATVEMMLNHSVGLPALRDPVKPGGFSDWDYMVERLAAEAPFWEPGTRNGYHMVTFGWTVGELVRRVSGKSLGTFFRDEVAKPLGLDFWIGLPEEHESRVAPVRLWVPGPDAVLTDFTKTLVADPKSISHLSLLNIGGWDYNSREGHAAEIGGGGGIANGRALSKMYNPIARGGEHEGVRLFSADHVERMGMLSMATLRDATLLAPTRFALGFMRSMDNRHRSTGAQETVILGRRAFGHVGAGGSIGFADPDCGLAFGYSMNVMGPGILLNPRGQSLVDATYEVLGYRTNAPGAWIP